MICCLVHCYLCRYRKKKNSALNIKDLSGTKMTGYNRDSILIRFSIPRYLNSLLLLTDQLERERTHFSLVLTFPSQDFFFFFKVMIKQDFKLDTFQISLPLQRLRLMLHGRPYNIDTFFRISEQFHRVKRENS